MKHKLECVFCAEVTPTAIKNKFDDSLIPLCNTCHSNVFFKRVSGLIGAPGSKSGKRKLEEKPESEESTESALKRRKKGEKLVDVKSGYINMDRVLPNDTHAILSIILMSDPELLSDNYSLLQVSEGMNSFLRNNTITYVCEYPHFTYDTKTNIRTCKYKTFNVEASLYTILMTNNLMYRYQHVPLYKSLHLCYLQSVACPILKNRETLRKKLEAEEVVGKSTLHPAETEWSVLINLRLESIVRNYEFAKEQWQKTLNDEQQKREKFELSGKFLDIHKHLVEQYKKLYMSRTDIIQYRKPYDIIPAFLTRLLSHPMVFTDQYLSPGDFDYLALISNVRLSAKAERYTYPFRTNFENWIERGGQVSNDLPSLTNHNIEVGPFMYELLEILDPLYTIEDLPQMVLYNIGYVTWHVGDKTHISKTIKKLSKKINTYIKSHIKSDIYRPIDGNDQRYTIIDIRNKTHAKRGFIQADLQYYKQYYIPDNFGWEISYPIVTDEKSLWVKNYKLIKDIIAEAPDYSEMPPFNLSSELVGYNDILNIIEKKSV